MRLKLAYGGFVCHEDTKTLRRKDVKKQDTRNKTKKELVAESPDAIFDKSDIKIDQIAQV
jgi:hypothetical protein